jgi:hypothetical protein
MKMAVAIRLAKDLEKGAPDLPRPVHFRKGQIVYIGGPIHRPGERYKEWSFWENPDIDLAIIFGKEDVSEVYVWQGRCEQCKPEECVAIWQCPICGEESEYLKPGFNYCTKCRTTKDFKRSFWRERKVDPCSRCRDEYKKELEKFQNAPWPVYYKKPEE